MKWFRVYSEARTDAKLESLTDAQHRVWFRLMCFAGDQVERGDIMGYDEELLAVEVARGDVDLLRSTLERLVKLRIIAVGDGVSFLNWEKRQYDKPSDSPEQTRERKRKSRASSIDSAPVTPMSRDVTPHKQIADTESESETEPEALATAARAPARETELSPGERTVVANIKQVRGMANVPDAAIVLHLREIIANRGSPVSEAALVADSMNFREHWNDQRRNQPRDERWSDRGWKKGMTNWFTRTKEAQPVPISGNRRGTRDPNFDGIETFTDAWKRAEAH